MKPEIEKDKPAEQMRETVKEEIQPAVEAPSEAKVEESKREYTPVEEEKKSPP